MNSDDNDGLKALAIILGVPVLVALIIILTIPFSLLGAWGVQKMYDWFLQQPLHFPHLNLWHVWGLMMLINLVIYTPDNNDDGAKKAVGRLFGRVIGIFVVVLIGYLIKGHIH